MLIMALGLMAKAKPRRRRAMGTYIRGNITLDLTLGTLAARTAVLSAFQDTVVNRTFISSIVATITLSNATGVDNVGPILFGYAHSDYTGAEIEEYIELVTSWDAGDKVSQEIGSRLVRRVGTIETPALSTDSRVFNDGRPIKTKLNWMIQPGQTIDFWVYNLGTAAFTTTDPNVNIQGHANLWPR